jgi:hypothetical protein
MPEASTLGAASPAEAARSVFEWISKSERLTDRECLNRPREVQVA